MNRGAVHLGIIFCTAATAVIHFKLAFPNTLFILNGVGYLALLAALYLPLPALERLRRTIRLTLMGYTLLTIFLWYIMAQPGPLGYATKAVEVVLVVLLWVAHRRS